MKKMKNKKKYIIKQYYFVLLNFGSTIDKVQVFLNYTN